MSEQSIAQARASVMLYNNERKEWEHSGGTSGIARVHVYHHPINNTYRIVGRKVQDHSVVINCALAKGLKYNEATPTFHQWRDQRQVYGLNFPSKEDAQGFGHAVFTALEFLKSGASVPQPQPVIQHMSNGRNEPEDMSLYHRDQPQYDAHDQYSRGRPSAGPERTYHNQYEMQRERHSPSPSTTSLSTSPGPLPVIQSSAPPAPPAPPVPAAPPVPNAPPAPPAAPPVPGVGGPPPPPPPPPPAVPSGGGGGGGGSLADQIAAAKLKKASKAESEGPRSDRANSTSRSSGGKGIGGGMNMMEEMARKLAARKAKEEGREVEPIREEVESRPEKTGPRSSSTNPPSAPAFGNNNSKANFSTPAKPSSNGGVRKPSKSESTLSNEQLEELKSELLAEFRQELDAAKREIIDALKQEISRIR